MQADRVSEAGWEADVRPIGVGVYIEYESRGKPAGAFDAEGCIGAGGCEFKNVRGTGRTVLSGTGVRVREERRRQRTPADQCAELRALQDVRYQGPDAEHCVGTAGRWRRAELPEYVRGVRTRSGVSSTRAKKDRCPILD